MADAVRLISIRRGYDPRDFALVVFGGAGPLHGADLARELSIPTVIVPPNPGVTSALGCLLVDIQHDLAESYIRPAADADPAAIEAEFATLEREAWRADAPEGVGDRDVVMERSIDMRYRGQWRSLAVPVGSPVGPTADLVAAFHAQHEREYNFRRDDAPVEFYRLNLRAVGIVPKAAFARARRPTGVPPQPVERRAVWFEGGRRCETPVYSPRPTCPAGTRFDGPAIDRAARLDHGRAAGLSRAEVDGWLNILMRDGGLNMATQQGFALDPVTFEVLKNAFITTVDQMAEQILRTCHSFVIFNRDFSSALTTSTATRSCRATSDIAVHVGTLHYTCKAVIESFEGDMHPGDVFAINDPYVGGTHFNDVRIIRPIFVDGELIAYAQSNGHWSDVGGTRAGLVRRHGEGALRRGHPHHAGALWDSGRFRRDVAHLIASNTRDPASIIGDMHAQAEATRVAEREILRLVDKYGKDTVLDRLRRGAGLRRARRRASGFASCRTASGRPRTTSTATRSGGEGLIPIKVKMTIEGDRVIYDLSGWHPCIGSFYNSAFGTTFSAVRRGDEDVLPRPAAELRLLPRRST